MLSRLSLSSSSLAGLTGTRLHYPQAPSGQTDAERCAAVYKCRSNEKDAKRSVHLNPLTATTLREIYAHLRPKTRPFFPGHAPDTNALTDIHPEVVEALRARKPAISLESTVITHGIPHPINLETAKSVERNVRVSEGVPATTDLTTDVSKLDSSHTSFGGTQG